jgi:signal transduction histidine kinase
MRRSLRNRLALVFFAITLVAIAALYLYVAPGLRSRLLSQRMGELASAARTDSTQIVNTVGSTEPARAVQQKVDAAALNSGDRVTLLLVSRTPTGIQLSAQADSSKPAAAGALPETMARAAASQRRLLTGTEAAQGGTVAAAAIPVLYHGRVADVVVYSSSVSDILRSVGVIRHQILIAGGLALLLALVGGYLVARALAQRVKRLELAAQQVAAGDFEHPITVDSPDELGQLAVAFNQMQHQLAVLGSAREKFIATASHELRTPVFSLGGFIELLEDEDLDEETRQRFMEQVKTCSICRGSSPARSSCVPSRLTWANSRARSQASSSPRWPRMIPTWSCDSRRARSKRSAIPCAWPRSCGS